MREVKFRAWDKMQKELVKVNAIALNANCFDTKSYLHGSQPHLYDEDGVLHLLEDCELLQFTGLYDKNGQEIYEGDIVKGKAIKVRGGFSYLGKIIFYNQSNIHGYFIEDKNGAAWRLEQAQAIVSLDRITGEVIGNIYENPDLLEGD